MVFPRGARVDGWARDLTIERTCTTELRITYGNLPVPPHFPKRLALSRSFCFKKMDAMQLQLLITLLFASANLLISSSGE